MIRFKSSRQLTLEAFDWPFQTHLDADNRWVKLGNLIPWDDLAEEYYRGLAEERGRPAKDARLVIGAVIIKHQLVLSDRETVAQIRENPYLQFFVGLPGFQAEAPFAPSLFVDVRKRMGTAFFDAFHQSILEALPASDKTESTPAEPPEDEPPAGSGGGNSEETPKVQGKLILDATVAPQAIRYPTDLSLLNEARQFSETIIDRLYADVPWGRKPRTYREKARKDYLAIAKMKRPGKRRLRRGIKQQLQYLRRNLGHIDRLLDALPSGVRIPLPYWLLQRYWVIQHVYEQQWVMYRDNSRRCDDRIVSLNQPQVRPIVRGKVDKPVEFGAKLSVNLTSEGLARVDHLRWDAFHEGRDLPSQVEAYRERYGHYPEAVFADQIYGTRDNRNYLKSRGIRFAGKPLGRPKKQTDANASALKKEAEKRRQEQRQRIPIEGKFGQGKNGYRLNYIRAKRADTSAAWINSIFLVMNLLVLIREFFYFRQMGSSYCRDWWWSNHRSELLINGWSRNLNRFDGTQGTARTLTS